MKTNISPVPSAPGRIKNRLLLLVSSSLLTGCQDHLSPSPIPSVLTLATGLLAPLGVEADAAGRVWVAEAGTAKNDGRVSILHNSATLLC